MVRCVHYVMSLEESRFEKLDKLPQILDTYPRNLTTIGLPSEIYMTCYDFEANVFRGSFLLIWFNFNPDMD